MTKKLSTKKLLSRRDTLRLMGAAGATAIVGLSSFDVWRILPTNSRISTVQAQSLNCVVRPQLTEGPYFVDERLNRSDIRIDPSDNSVRAGVQLRLKFNVSRVVNGMCVALPGAYVDIWHCDAAGAYSDISNGAGQANTSGKKYLRGYQIAGSNGAVEFITVYPGWYSGRAVHIHFKIRLFSGSTETYEFTSQLFFNDTVSDQVYAQSPYNTRGTRNTRNSNDGIYNGGGSQLLLDITQDGAGYAATFNIGLQGITSVPTPSVTPTVSGATVSKKKLIVTGTNFSSGASLYLNGTKQKKTFNDETSPTTMLIANKSGKLISAGQTVMLQVVNSDGTSSNEFTYTRAS